MELISMIIHQIWLFKKKTLLVHRSTILIYNFPKDVLFKFLYSWWIVLTGARLLNMLALIPLSILYTSHSPRIILGYQILKTWINNPHIANYRLQSLVLSNLKFCQMFMLFSINWTENVLISCNDVEFTSLHFL